MKKKPVLNPILTLALGLPAKHSDVFYCRSNPNLPQVTKNSLLYN